MCSVFSGVLGKHPERSNPEWGVKRGIARKTDVDGLCFNTRAVLMWSICYSLAFLVVFSVSVCLPVSVQFFSRPGRRACIWWAACQCFPKHAFLVGYHTYVYSSTTGCSVRSPLNLRHSLHSPKSPVRQCLGQPDSPGLSDESQTEPEPGPGPPADSGSSGSSEPYCPCLSVWD